MRISVKSKKISDIITWVTLALISAAAIYPLVLIVFVSLKTDQEFVFNPIGLPQAFQFSNFLTVYDRAKIPLAARNSFIVTSVSIILQLITGSLAAYALTKMKFRKSAFYSNAFLFPMIFPIQTMVFPLYIMLKNMNLTNTLSGMILVYTAMGLPLIILILTGFMKTIPYEVSEAAIVDGAGHFRIYSMIIVPLIKPAIATSVVLSALSVWNDFFLPLIMVTKSDVMTLPMAVFQFKGLYQTSWPMVCACIVFLVVPMMIAYVFLQKHIVSGVVAGAVKG